MIRINLLGEKVDHSAAFLVHGLSLAVAVFLTVLGCFVVHQSKVSEREILTNEKGLLESQLARLREKTKKVEELDAKKKLVQEKLMTIARLKAKKSGPVHLLSDISGATPQRSWLASIRSKSDGLEFNGIALDPQTVSTFMTQLMKSEWIGDVELKESKQAIKEQTPVQSFTLLVKTKTPLDAKKGVSSRSTAAATPAAPGCPPGAKPGDAACVVPAPAAPASPSSAAQPPAAR